MACLTIAVETTFISLLVETQLIALIVLSFLLPGKKMKERGSGGRATEEENVNVREEEGGRSQLVLRFGQRANERNKARVIKITVAVV